MKSILLLPGLLLYLSALSQKKEEINYSDPFQVDSSAYFLIPKLLDGDNKEDYGKGKGYFLWGNYSDIHFYNTATNQTKKLFGATLALIVPFTTGRQHYYYERQDEQAEKAPPNILPRHIVYLARTADYNGDKALDSDDPVYLYISTKTGDNLTRVTPEGFNVISWTLSKDKRLILVKLQQDKNGNKKFGNGDDDVYYRIDLHDDVAQIKCYPVPL